VAVLKNGLGDLPQSASAQNNLANQNAQQGVTATPATNQQPATATQPAGNVNNNNSNPPVPRN
jgi:hypothetical protein